MSPHDFPLALFRPPIVLVVENRPSLHSPTGRLVGMLGYEVRRARTGEQALGLVRHHRGLFDLILTNILLPDVDCGRFRAAHSARRARHPRRMDRRLRADRTSGRAGRGAPRGAGDQEALRFSGASGRLAAPDRSPRAAVPLADTLRSPRPPRSEAESLNRTDYQTTPAARPAASRMRRRWPGVRMSRSTTCRTIRATKE